MKLLLALLVLTLCGCAAHTWAPGPGLSAADFEPAKARCSLLARHGDSGFVAVGSQSYVAGAAIGHAIGEGVRANQDFNDCMLASGWRIADGQNAATQSVAVAQIKVAKDQLTACVAATRNKPEYSPLLPHLADLSTARFTMAQLTDEHVPSLTESRVATAYADDISPCVSKYVEDIARSAPAVGPILLQMRASIDEVNIQLCQRKLTWGEAAHQAQQIQDDTTAKLREMHL